LNGWGFRGEIWVDGSFLTEKIDPKDIDIAVRCDGPLYNSNAEYRDAVSWINENQKNELKCDSYVFFEYPAGDPLHEEGKWWYSYWWRQWGFSREGDPKGIVVIKLNGGPL
jgi:hypothetical protein